MKLDCIHFQSSQQTLWQNLAPNPLLTNSVRASQWLVPQNCWSHMASRHDKLPSLWLDLRKALQNARDPDGPRSPLPSSASGWETCSVEGLIGNWNVEIWNETNSKFKHTNRKSIYTHRFLHLLHPCYLFLFNSVWQTSWVHLQIQELPKKKKKKKNVDFRFLNLKLHSTRSTSENIDTPGTHRRMPSRCTSRGHRCCRPRWWADHPRWSRSRRWRWWPRHHLGSPWPWHRCLQPGEPKGQKRWKLKQVMDEACFFASLTFI